MSNGQPQGFADDLAGGGGAEELATAAGTGAGAAAEIGCFLQGDLAVGVAHAQCLDLAGVFAGFGGQGDAAGDEHAGEIAHRGQCHHHGRQALVAGGDAHHAAAPRQRADQPPQHHGGVVAEREAVHHPGGPLCPAVAGIGAERRERDDAAGLQLSRGGLDQQVYFPVSGMKAQSDGRAVGGAEAAAGREDQELLPAQLGHVPSHTGILRQAEEIAAGPVAQHRFGERQAAAGAGGAPAHVVERIDAGIGVRRFSRGDGVASHGIDRLEVRTASAEISKSSMRCVGLRFSEDFSN